MFICVYASVCLWHADLRGGVYLYMYCVDMVCECLCSRLSVSKHVSVFGYVLCVCSHTRYVICIIIFSKLFATYLFILSKLFATWYLCYMCSWIVLCVVCCVCVLTCVVMCIINTSNIKAFLLISNPSERNTKEAGECLTSNIHTNTHMYTSMYVYVHVCIYVYL